MNVHFFSAKGRRLTKRYMRVESRIAIVDEGDFGVLLSAVATDGRRMTLQLGPVEARTLELALGTTRKGAAR